MKFSPNAKAALSQPDTRSVAIEMTPERRERYKKITAELVDRLKAETEGPLEAYMVLQFMVHSFEKCYGIRGGVIVNLDDQES